MALSSEQLAWVARIVRESYAVAVAKTATLNAAQESILSDDIDLWESIENRHVVIRGDGVDLNNERKRRAIFYRVRDMLGLPLVIYEIDAQVMELVELEVGQNFG
jgi:hypothetical protein